MVNFELGTTSREKNKKNLLNKKYSTVEKRAKTTPDITIKTTTTQ